MRELFLTLLLWPLAIIGLFLFFIGGMLEITLKGYNKIVGIVFDGVIKHFRQE